MALVRIWIFVLVAILSLAQALKIELVQQATPFFINTPFTITWRTGPSNGPGIYAIRPILHVFDPPSTTTLEIIPGSQFTVGAESDSNGSVSVQVTQLGSYSFQAVLERTNEIFSGTQDLVPFVPVPSPTPTTTTDTSTTTKTTSSSSETDQNTTERTSTTSRTEESSSESPSTPTRTTSTESTGTTTTSSLSTAGTQSKTRRLPTNSSSSSSESSDPSPGAVFETGTGPQSTPGVAAANASTSKPPIGAIVGGTIGGLVLLLGGLVALLLIRRRRRKAYEGDDIVVFNRELMVRSPGMETLYSPVGITARIGHQDSISSSRASSLRRGSYGGEKAP